MGLIIGKFMTAMFNSKMFCIAHIDSSMIPTPTLRMNHTIEAHRASYGLLQRTFAHIRHTFRRDPVMAFEQAKNKGFTAGTTTSFAPNSLWTNVRSIDFDLAR